MQRPWLWVAVVLVLLPMGGLLWLRHSVMNVMHPALDTLAAIPLSERWSHPEMVKIRNLGERAVPPLRRVLREKDSLTTQFLLWVKAKWPGAATYFSHFPDQQKLTERRWTACQVIQTLGPAARAAAPEIIEVLESKDGYEVNGGIMALWAIGIDADICERLDSALEKGAPTSGKMQMLTALAHVKPPSKRTLVAVTAALRDPVPYVQDRAVETLGQLGVASSAVVSALHKLQVSSSNELLVVHCSAALWDLERSKTAGWTPVVNVLQAQLARATPAIIGGGNGGQGVSAEDQCFMAASALFTRMKLGEAEKAQALDLLERWCDKSGRIFIRMLLLSPMMDLGYPPEKCLEVCRTGLKQQEEYYQIQAAQLLMHVSERYPVDAVDLEALLHAREVGVRVYAARIHWRKQHQAAVVVPVLREALNREKHQSYYYVQLLPAALQGLAEIGPEASEAAGDLERLTQDPNPTVAKLAREALGKVRR